MSGACDLARHFVAEAERPRPFFVRVAEDPDAVEADLADEPSELDRRLGRLACNGLVPGRFLQDVAQAFLAQALALKTTADVTTVDGGNIAAALR